MKNYQATKKHRDASQFLLTEVIHN